MVATSWENPSPPQSLEHADLDSADDGRAYGGGLGPQGCVGSPAVSAVASAGALDAAVHHEVGTTPLAHEGEAPGRSRLPPNPTNSINAVSGPSKARGVVGQAEI
jgi:hypothetical protein